MNRPASADPWTRQTLRLLAAALIAAAPATLAAGEIWIEGESARSSDVRRHSWYDSVKKGLLSGGEWLSHFGGDRDGTAEYEVEAKAAGRYTLWVRANPIQAALSYRLNGGDWIEIDTARPLDSINIAADDKPDLRFVAWIEAGAVPLRKGANTVSLKMHSANGHHGAIDCFLLTTGSFRPRGSLRPGQKLGLAEKGSWAFEPDADAFDPKALLDLRALNEKTAGESGWVRRTPDGGFALGNGKPVRFWAVNTTVQGSPDPKDLPEHARFLAKRGVNMVRFHGAIWPKGPRAKLTDVDGEEIDRCQRLVAAMKKEGIYTTISPYWAIAARAQPGWGLEGHPSGNLPGLLFWDEDLQAAYRAWVKELLTRPNPHAGGIPLGKDPAVAIFQIQNEDSLLFWTLQSIRGEELKRLRAHHGRWLAKRHGSLEKARRAWGGLRIDGDDPASGEMGLLGLWEYQPDVEGGKAARLADQLRYLAETMHAFNEMAGDFVRRELGCPVLVNAGNWHTANEPLLLDAERWSYTANDVIGVNKYVTGVHVNPADKAKAGYLVSKGDFFTEASALLAPGKIPTNLKQVAGRPFIISESNWVPPLRHQSEGPFLVAAYSSLGGADVYYWFSMSSPGYDATLSKWQAATPAILGGFPAAALVFRKGYVREGKPAVHEERTLEEVLSFRPSLLSEAEPFDPNRSAGIAAAEPAGRDRVHPLAFLVGPVEVRYGGDPARSRVADVGRYIDEEKRTVASSTGELKLDYGIGVATIDAPRAKGASGFLSRSGEIRLGAVRIACRNEYATIIIAPLDDRELTSSRKVLVQATTVARPYGWRESAATFEADEKTIEGKRIDDTGSAPWNVADTQATITVRNPGLRRAILLDLNGMPARTLEGETKDGAFRLTLPPDAMYVVLEGG